MEATLENLGSATENAVLREIIRREIVSAGPITFRRFMELALYEPHEGYYSTRQAIGPRGDYLTSPEVHPLFGAILCRQLDEFWQILGRPAPFTLLEVGAGNGTLARSILAASASSGLGETLRYVIAEPRRHQRDGQEATLSSLAGSVTWVEAPAQLGAGAVACVISNELLDSFPVHRVTVASGALREVFVGLADGRFVDLVGEPSTPALGEYFARLGLLPGEDCVAEVNLGVPDWIAGIAPLLARGFVLTIDYGYSAAQLYASWRRQGTLQCYTHHTSSTDPYERIGKQDMTAHVDFSTLVQAGRLAGLTPLGFTTQQRFLAALGIEDALAGGPMAAPSLEEYLARRRAVEALLNPEGLGRMRVLVQGRGVDQAELRGFGGSAVEGLL